MSHLKIYISPELKDLFYNHEVFISYGDNGENYKNECYRQGEEHFKKVTTLYKEAIEKFNKEKTLKHRNSGFDIFVPYNTGKPYEYSRELGIYAHSIDHYIRCAVYDKEGNPLPYYLYPRSSISKTYMRMSNSVGIIDSGYRGNIIAKVDIMPNHITTFHLNFGERFFQLCSHNLLPFESVELIENQGDLEETERGEGGFGSTGR